MFTEIANGPRCYRKSFADCFINSLTVPWSYNFDYSGSFRNHKYFTQKDWFLPVLARYQLLFHSICSHDLQGDPLQDKVATAFRQKQTDVPVAGPPRNPPELPFVPFTSRIRVHQSPFLRLIYPHIIHLSYNEVRRDGGWAQFIQLWRNPRFIPKLLVGSQLQMRLNSLLNKSHLTMLIKPANLQDNIRQEVADSKVCGARTRGICASQRLHRD